MAVYSSAKLLALPCRALPSRALPSHALSMNDSFEGLSTSLPRPAQPCQALPCQEYE